MQNELLSMQLYKGVCKNFVKQSLNFYFGLTFVLNKEESIINYIKTDVGGKKPRVWLSYFVEGGNSNIIGDFIS